MAAEYINRDPLLDKTNVAFPDDGSPYVQGQMDALDWCRGIIESIPALHGREQTNAWRKVEAGPTKTYYFCDCGSSQGRRTLFCPSCESRMAWP